MAHDLSTSAISFKSDEESVAGYLARPSSGGPHPGLIVLQEWWGLEGHIKDLTDRLSLDSLSLPATLIAQLL